MRQFECRYCGSPITVVEKVGEPVVCPTCDTPHVVPTTASVVMRSEPTGGAITASFMLGQAVRAVAGADSEVPEYWLVRIGGWTAIVVGVVWILSGAIVAGIIALGIGQALHCVRDTARNSWRRGAHSSRA